MMHFELILSEFIYYYNSLLHSLRKVINDYSHKLIA